MKKTQLLVFKIQNLRQCNHNKSGDERPLERALADAAEEIRALQLPPWSYWICGCRGHLYNTPASKRDLMAEHNLSWDFTRNLMGKRKNNQRVKTEIGKSEKNISKFT